jgi:hypothetical protein
VRSYEEPIEVKADRTGRPFSIAWRKQHYDVVKVIECWCWAGHWWMDGLLQRRIYYRVEVCLGSRYHLPYRNRTLVIYERRPCLKGRSWMLSASHD